MQLVYYYDTDLKIAPVKQFLSKYEIKKDDNPQQKEHKIRMYARIQGVFKIAVENNGIVGGQFSSPLRKYKFQEFRIKDSDLLNRIYYFCYYRDKIVLLNALEKPDNYDKGLKKKVVREEEKILRQTQEFYLKFIQNPNSYEKYQETKN